MEWMNWKLLFPYCIYFHAVVINFSVLKVLDDVTVAAAWEPVQSPDLSHYTVYYKPDTSQAKMNKRQTNEEELTVVFPAGSSSGLIGELEEGENYLFSIAVYYNISGKLYEGNKSDYAQPSIGKEVILVFIVITIM